MKRSFNHLWIFFITIQEVLHYGQTKIIQDRPSETHYSRRKIIQDDPSETLKIDQGYLTISNKNYSDSILFMFNVIACEYCDFDQLGDTLSINSSQTLIIDTQYPYDFQLLTESMNGTLICQVQSYRFSEHGSYLFEVIRTDQNQSSCTINQTQPSSYYWTPVIVGIILLCIFVLFIQLCHHIHERRYIDRFRTNISLQRLVNDEINETPPASPSTNRREPSIVADETHHDDIITIATGSSELPLVGSTRLSNNSVRITKVLPKRLRSLDTFRGFSLMVMIFVNYGGGSYWFFNHSVWNGLTLADLVFPWFVWMMGVSIVLSQRSLRAKNIRKRSIFLKICRRTATLFLLGLILNGGHGKLKDLRILGVLQRLGLCYFFTATLVLIFDDTGNEPHSSEWAIGNDVHQPMRVELSNTVFHFWPQWFSILFIIFLWILITFVPKLSNCPRGYVGPGGKHEHGKYQNCTGGIAGYLDQLILGSSHLYNEPTCKGVYNTQVPFDPEGLLGILTGTLLCYLGVQAGHSFAHSTRVRRVCAQWLVSGLICGFLGLLLSKGGHSDSWIPINKNLWSLTFVLILASLAFIILTILYLLVDVHKWFTGEPWLWLGMNSIVIYVGSEVCSGSFPIQFEVNETHAEKLAMHAYGATYWILVAGVMYYKKVFIAI